ncbi:MAG: monovalent cation/H(+) antiporter subunit G [Phycisphaeraceae bacterium]
MTTQLILDTFAIFFLIVGLFFMLVGAIGVFRLPDVFHRLHAASKCSTLGMMGLVLAASLHVGTAGVIAKSIAVVLFIFVSTPVGSHMLAKAAHRDKAPQWKGTLSDELAEDNAKADKTEAKADSKKKSKTRAA